jgi:hypothetical protein
LHELLTSPTLSNNLTQLSLSNGFDDGDHGIGVTLGTYQHQHDQNQPDGPADLLISTQHLKFGRLQRASLSGCEISADDIKAITNLSSLTHLHLSDNPMSDAGVAALVALDEELSTLSYPLPRLSNLTNLKINGCALGDVGMAALSKSPIMEQLEVLTLKITPQQNSALSSPQLNSPISSSHLYSCLSLFRLFGHHSGTNQKEVAPRTALCTSSKLSSQPLIHSS